MFNLPYALPLIFIRTSGARVSHARDAELARQLPPSRPEPQTIPNHGHVINRTEIFRVRGQSAAVFRPHPRPYLRLVREHATAADWDDTKTAFQNSYDDLKNSIKQAWQWLADKLSS